MLSLSYHEIVYRMYPMYLSKFSIITSNRLRIEILYSCTYLYRPCHRCYDRFVPNTLSALNALLIKLDHAELTAALSQQGLATRRTDTLNLHRRRKVPQGHSDQRYGRVDHRGIASQVL
eukprot:SAG11_NODE_22706_length_401_cov_1.145695_1_plen_118_part_10